MFLDATVAPDPELPRTLEDGSRGVNPGHNDTEEEIMADHVATATVEIDASPGEVWTALTDPPRVT